MWWAKTSKLSVKIGFNQIPSSHIKFLVAYPIIATASSNCVMSPLKSMFLWVDGSVAAGRDISEFITPITGTIPLRSACCTFWNVMSRERVLGFNELHTSGFTRVHSKLLTLVGLWIALILSLPCLLAAYGGPCCPPPWPICHWLPQQSVRFPHTVVRNCSATGRLGLWLVILAGSLERAPLIYGLWGTVDLAIVLWIRR